MNIGFLITGRLKSKRLPLKLMLDLDGMRVIEQVVQRVTDAKFPGPIVICTSPTEQDTPLCGVAKELGIHCYQGQPEDVLQRLLNTCQKHGLDGLVGITGENPLFDRVHIDQTLEHLRQGADLVKFKGLPIGCAPYGISRVLLETMCEVGEEEDTSMWGYLLDKPDIFNVHHIEVAPEYQMPTIRLTVDHAEDLELIRAIFAKIPKPVRLLDALELLRKEPELLKINAHLVQEDMELVDKQRIADFFTRKQGELVRVHANMKSKFQA